MANLGPQKINLSFGSVLQVAGGLTSSLQSVSDGNGVASALQLSTTGISGTIASNNVTITGGTINGTTIGATSAAAGNFTTLSATGTTTLASSLSGILKGTSGVVGLATAGTDYQSAITATGILKGAGAGTVSSAVSGTDYAPGTSALNTGILKSTTSTGALSIAVVGTDYAPATTGTAILKGNGSGGFSNATSGTDYAPATSGTSLLKGNGSGGFSNATSGTDYAPATSGTSILYGSGSGGFSNVTVGSGLTFTGGTLASVAGGGGTVTDMSVVTANGFAGTVATSTTTPAVTLTTTVTGLLKGNGTAISAAVAGTDYPGLSTTNTFTANQTVSGNLTASALIPSSATIPTNGLFLPTTNALGFATNSTERLRLDASGNLGIGTSSPAAKLDVASTSTGVVKFTASGAKPGWLYSDSAGIAISDTADLTKNGLYINNTSNFVAIYTGSTGAERLRLDSSGNLGLGVTPSAWTTYKALQIGGAGFMGTSDALNASANAYYNAGWKYYGTGLATLYNQAAGVHSWYNAVSGTAGNAISLTQAMTLDASGNLLVGTTSANGRLTVVSGSATQSPISTIGVSGDTAYQGILVTKFDNNATTSQNFIQFQINNGAANSGKITANGANTAAFASTSDSRVKENVVDLPSQLKNILALRPVEFDYIESYGGGHQTGFIAQEIQAVYPDVVSADDSEEKILSITGWSKTEARLVKAIQEIAAELNELKQKVNA